MRRIAWLATLATSVACAKNPPPTVAPEPVPPTEPAPEPEPAGPVAAPSDALGAIHHCDVQIEESISLPSGFVVAYTFGRLDATIGELEADGMDVRADIEAETAKCEADRAQLPEDERDWLEYGGRSCEEETMVELFDDDQLTPDCGEVGLALFDLQGRVRSHEVLGLGCLDRFDSLQLRELVPGQPPQLVMITTHGTVGEFSRGGWGYVETQRYLHLLGPVSKDGELVSDGMRVALDISKDGGACGYGTAVGVRVREDGHLVRYEQNYEECADEGCLLPEDVDGYRDAMNLDEDDELDMELCEDFPVSSSVIEWDAELAQWDETGDEVELDEPNLMPTDLDY